MARHRLRIEPTIGTGTVGVGWADGRPPVAASPNRPYVLVLVAGLLLAYGLTEILVFFGVLPSYLQFHAIDALRLDKWRYGSLATAIACSLAGLSLIAGRPSGWYLAILICVAGLGATLAALATIYQAGTPLALWSGHAVGPHASLMLGAALSLCLLDYLLTRPVRAYCKVK